MESFTTSTAPARVSSLRITSSGVTLALVLAVFQGCRSCPRLTSLPPVPTTIDKDSAAFKARVLRLENSCDPAPGPAMPPGLVDIHMHTFNANYLPLPRSSKHACPTSWSA